MHPRACTLQNNQNEARRGAHLSFVMLFADNSNKSIFWEAFQKSFLIGITLQLNENKPSLLSSEICQILSRERTNWFSGVLYDQISVIVL